MASTTYWKSWAFNFYYGEELRSLYMNGVLLAGFRPGVYNANIISFKHGSDLDSPLNFIIKRGTTLIFSNNYKKVGNLVEREFMGIGKETFETDDQYSYLIKCVANEDILLSEDVFTEKFKTNTESFHLFARIKYSAKGEGASSNSGYPEVEFIPYTLRETSGSELYGRFKEITADESLAVANPPDGISYAEFRNRCNSSAEYLKYSFLDLGVVRKKEGNSDKFSFSNYIFTGRGLPEYRQSIIPNVNILTPDFIVGKDFKSLYLDIPGISVDDVIYENTAENITEEIAKNFTGTFWREGENKITLGAISESEYSSDNLFPEPATTSASPNRYACFVDLVYLSTDKKVSNSTYLESAAGEAKIDWREMLLEDKSLTLHTKRLKVQGPNNRNAAFIGATIPADVGEFNSFDPGADFEMNYPDRGPAQDIGLPNVKKLSHKLYDFDYIFYQGSTAQDDGNLTYSSSVYYGPIVPLDISIGNQKRLFNIIKNKRIVPIMIDKIRQEDSNITARGASTIVPVALIFRKYVKSGDSTAFWVGGPNDAEIIDSANIINLLDLQFKETKVYPVTIKNSDVYSTLPVIY